MSLEEPRAATFGLLTDADIVQPLKPDELQDAAITLATAGQEFDPTAQKAVAYYARRMIQQTVADPTASAEAVGQAVGNTYDTLPTKLEEDDFLAKLVKDLRELWQIQPPAAPSKLQSLLAAIKRHRQVPAAQPVSKSPVPRSAPSPAEQLTIAQQKTARRIAERIARKDRSGSLPWSVRGGKFGQSLTRHDPAVYAQVQRLLYSSGTRSFEIFRVSERTGLNDLKHRADVISPYGMNNSKERTINIYSPFEFPRGFFYNCSAAVSRKYRIELLKDQEFQLYR